MLSGRVEVVTTARRVEDRVDDQMQALAGAGRSDDEDRVLDRGPDLPAVRAAEQVGDLLSSRVPQ
jgi:hypothetical protein